MSGKKEPKPVRLTEMYLSAILIFLVVGNTLLDMSNIGAGIWIIYGLAACFTLLILGLIIDGARQGKLKLQRPTRSELVNTLLILVIIFDISFDRISTGNAKTAIYVILIGLFVAISLAVLISYFTVKNAGFDEKETPRQAEA